MGHRRCVGHGGGRRRRASLLAVAGASICCDSGRRHSRRLDTAGRPLSGRRTGWPPADDVLLAHVRLHVSDRAPCDRRCGGAHAQHLAGESASGDADGCAASVDAGLELSDAGRAGCDLHAAAGHRGPLSAGALPISTGIESPEWHADRAAAGNTAGHVVRVGTPDLPGTAVCSGVGGATKPVGSLDGSPASGPGSAGCVGIVAESYRPGVCRRGTANGGRFGGRHRCGHTAFGRCAGRGPRLVVPHADLAVVDPRAAGECLADAVVGEPLRWSASLAGGGRARRRHGDLSRRVEPAAEGAAGGDRRAGDRPGLRQGVARGAGGDGVWQDGRGD